MAGRRIERILWAAGGATLTLLAVLLLSRSPFGFPSLRRIVRLVAPPTDQVTAEPAWQDAVEEFETLNRKYRGRKVIVFAGDSLTRRFLLHERFPAVDRAGRPVLNRGINGDTVQGLEQRAERNLGNLEIEKLFVMFGTNDLLYRSPEETVRRLEAQLRRFAKTRIFVQSILPTRSTREPTHRNVVDYNQALAEMCRRNGFTFIDLYSSFVDPKGEMKPEFQRDGVHPNGRGYQRWLELLEPHLAEAPPAGVHG